MKYDLDSKCDYCIFLSYNSIILKRGLFFELLIETKGGVYLNTNGLHSLWDNNKI